MRAALQIGDAPPPSRTGPLTRRRPCRLIGRNAKGSSMFSKTDTAPAPARAPNPNAGKSVLASDLRITGDITSTGSVEVFGEIEGTLNARGLTIGTEGVVKGTVSAETVEVALSGGHQRAGVEVDGHRGVSRGSRAGRGHLERPRAFAGVGHRPAAERHRSGHR